MAARKAPGRHRQDLDGSMLSMIIESMPVADLRPYPGNARTHSRSQIQQIADSIRRFSFNNPVLISDDGEIIAGHGRVAAAKLLGFETVPTVRLSHLDAVQRRAYVVADNKHALNAGWDRELLAIELSKTELVRPAAATYCLRLPEAELLRLIPDRSGLHFVGCPNCQGGTQEGQLDWTLERPDEVYCRYCQMRFPNEKFPENQVVRVKNPRGEVQEYPCWESPEPPPRVGAVGPRRPRSRAKATATSSGPRRGSSPASISRRRPPTSPSSISRPAIDRTPAGRP